MSFNGIHLWQGLVTKVSSTDTSTFLSIIFVFFISLGNTNTIGCLISLAQFDLFLPLAFLLFDCASDGHRLREDVTRIMINLLAISFVILVQVNADHLSRSSSLLIVFFLFFFTLESKAIIGSPIRATIATALHDRQDVLEAFLFLLVRHNPLVNVLLKRLILILLLILISQLLMLSIFGDVVSHDVLLGIFIFPE